jgi:SAM-dependent methyltransferase
MTDKFEEVRALLAEARSRLSGLRWTPEDPFQGLADDWNALSEAIKDTVFYGNPRNPNPDRRRVEAESAAQSMQFSIDLLPHIQRILVRDYPRGVSVRLLDVGAGTGAGADLLARLYASNLLHTRMEVEAIDIAPWRQAWVACVHPRIGYQVMASNALPERAWDIVVCSHVIEHLDDPRPIIRDVLRASRGHALIYAPYRESPLSPGHVSVIEERTFEDLGRPVELHVLDSPGWSGDGRRCLLAIVDCRD